MKHNLPITRKERTFGDQEQLISSTNLAGIVTFVNPQFTAVSGFSEDELIGQSHNIVRHPDMPQLVYQDLWEHLKAGEVWMGLIKNRCRNGDYYWVDAYVTPIYEKGKLSGYESVRTRPRADDVARAEALYRRLRKAGKGPENGFSGEQLQTQAADLRRRLGPRLWHAFGFRPALLLIIAVALSAGVPLLNLSLALTVVAYTLVCALGMAGTAWILAPLRTAATEASKVIDNPLTQALYVGRKGAGGRIRLAMWVLAARRRVMLGRLSESARRLTSDASGARSVMMKTVQGIEKQSGDVEHLATSMHQMSLSVQEVARNTAKAAEAAQEVGEQTEDGQRTVHATADEIGLLSQRIERAAEAMERFKNDSDQIGKVVDVIRGVAEQTSLLALNAAIEAARAGQEGRGFAVVATEVGELAKRTQTSTGEIRNMIQSLQGVAGEALEAMGASKESAHAGVGRMEHMVTALESITKAVGVSNDMNNQISTATEEQSAVAEEINGNVERIRQVAEESTSAAHGMAEQTQGLLRLADELQSLVMRFV